MKVLVFLELDLSTDVAAGMPADCGAALNRDYPRTAAAAVSAALVAGTCIGRAVPEEAEDSESP